MSLCEFNGRSLAPSKKCSDFILLLTYWQFNEHIQCTNAFLNDDIKILVKKRHTVIDHSTDAL